MDGEASSGAILEGNAQPEGQGTDTNQQSTPESKWEGPEWLASMPEDLKGAKTLSKFKDTEALARSYINAERLIGQDKIPVPKTDEDFINTMRRLGAPDAPDKFTFDEKVAPESVRADIKAQLPWFKQVATEIGLTPKQAEKLVAAYGTNIAAQISQMHANDEYESSAALAALRKEWGADTDRQITVAKRALGHFLSPQLQTRLIQAGFGNEPELIKFLAKVGNDRMEELGIDRTGRDAVNVNSLKDEISKLQADPAYLDAAHPNHTKLVQKVQLMFQQLTNVQ